MKKRTSIPLRAWPTNEGEGGGGESWLLEVGASSPVYGESDDS